MEHDFRTGNWSLKWIKFFLFITNLMFVLLAVLVIATGGAIQSVYANFSSFVDEQFYSPMLMFISVGMITLAIATFGFIGTYKESSLLINIYCALLTVVFMLEVTGTLVGIYNRHEASEVLMRTLNSSVQRYPWNNNIQESVDFMQAELQCCGVVSYRDWEDVFAVVDLDNGNMRAELPASCCSAYQDGICVPFAVGCYPRMHTLLYHCLRTVISGLLLVAFVQIFAAMFAFVLGKRIRLLKTKSSLDAIQYHERVCSFDYKRLDEIRKEKSPDQTC